MIYILPEISDKNLLYKYVQEHYNHGELKINATLNLVTSNYDEWVEKIRRNALIGDESWGKSLLYLWNDKDRLIG